jgi:GNAT superfamily N-acetyltransferase
MRADIIIERAMVADVQAVAEMVGELLGEIMNRVGEQAFNFDAVETAHRLHDFLEREKYFVFVARNKHGESIGFVSLYESYALYAEGAFGTMPELYVRPGYRSQDVGSALVSMACSFGKSQGWKRLEVTTPPLPQFDRALAFYQREGFAISGGRKLRLSL